MAVDINLLPTDLRSRELKARSESAQTKDKTVEFSRPAQKAVTPPSGRAGSGWWRKLIGKISRLLVFSRTGKIPQPANGKVSLPVDTTAAVSAPPDRPSKKNNGLRYPAESKQDVVSSLAAAADKPSVLPPHKLTDTKTHLGHVKAALPETAQPTPAHAPSVLDQINVNLIPFWQRVQQAGPAKRFVVAVWLIAGLIVLAGWGGILFFQKQKTATAERLQTELINKQQQLELLQQESLENLRQAVRLEAVEQLLDKRTTWTALFSFLENNTVPAVYFSALAADSGGKLTLSGQAPNYTEVMRQMRAFEQAAEVAQVEVSNLQQIKPVSGESSVSFSFTLTVKPVLFQSPPLPLLEP